MGEDFAFAHGPFHPAAPREVPIHHHHQFAAAAQHLFEAREHPRAEIIPFAVAVVKGRVADDGVVPSGPTARTSLRASAGPI